MSREAAPALTACDLQPCSCRFAPTLASIICKGSQMDVPLRAAWPIIRVSALFLVAIECVQPTLRAQVTSASYEGIVVEEVVKGSAFESAGAKPLDVLHSWVRRPAPPANPDAAEGRLNTYFDFQLLRITQHPRGPVRFRGTRGGRPLELLVGRGEWVLAYHPNAPSEILSNYLRGRELIKQKKLEEGLAAWRQALADARLLSSAQLERWMSLTLASALAQARRWQEAHEFMPIPGAPGLSFAEILVLEKMRADFYLAAAEFGDAERTLRRAAAREEAERPDSLTAAYVYHDISLASYRRGDLKTAIQFGERAVTIRRRLAPGSLQLSWSLHTLANAVKDIGDLRHAEDLYTSALAIKNELTPSSLDVATTLDNLGIVARRRGDLRTAESFFAQSVAIRERRAPGSVALAGTWNNLGNAARDRGNFALADELYRKALAIKEKSEPGSLSHARTLYNLAHLYIYRADLDTAALFLRKALAIGEKIAPLGQETSSALDALGRVATLRGDLRTAQGFYSRALAIEEKRAAEGPGVASALANLGEAAGRLGETLEAQRLLIRALGIRERIAPDGLDVAASLFQLAELERSSGRPNAAVPLYRRCLSIRERLAPGSAAEAEALRGLSLTSRSLGRADLAARYLRRAVESLERQEARLGGTAESKTGFAAVHESYYIDYIELLLRLKSPAQAYGILERSRARSLLEMLAERDLGFELEVPLELDRERKITNADYDRAQAELGQLSPGKDASKVQALQGRLRELRIRQTDIAERIRETSPRLASLQYPQPLDLARAQAALDPGTALLSYSIGEKKSFLFVVRSGKGKPRLSVFPLALREKALRDAVVALRSSMDFRRGLGPENSLASQARKLYGVLIRPAEALITGADRLLIVPDGPLHTLPFAALVRSSKGRPQYLVEWKPLHTAVSATVYAELKRARRNRPLSDSSILVAAFGDPKYPPPLQKLRSSGKRSSESEEGISILPTDPTPTASEKPPTPTVQPRPVAGISSPEPRAETGASEVTDPDVLWAMRSGYNLVPLPATRREVETIADLFAPRATKYLGEEATEERAKAIGADTGVIHFACHGLLNERFPLDSALALTIPEKRKEGEDNGLLQAWEIFETLRIDADLVTLSACETALGKEIGGEGLVGLTRAFQYAGARSILASLWKVADDSTGQLMKRFYQQLRAGKPKDEALRSAQLDLIGTSASTSAYDDLSHPAHWAAFQLIGDWK